MGVLRIGSLSVFLSDMLVSGFTTAAAVHVLTSQLKPMLGITTPPYSGPFKLVYVSVYHITPFHYMVITLCINIRQRVTQKFF